MGDRIGAQMAGGREEEQDEPSSQSRDHAANSRPGGWGGRGTLEGAGQGQVQQGAGQSADTAPTMQGPCIGRVRMGRIHGARAGKGERQVETPHPAPRPERAPGLANARGFWS